MTLFDDESEEKPSSRSGPQPVTLDLHDIVPDAQAGSEDTGEPFVISEAVPESYGETARKSGLAWSMGVAFFGAVGFMLILGWGFDVLFGSSPWGVVGGIVIGSVIGFVQFFRISSQIFRK